MYQIMQVCPVIQQAPEIGEVLIIKTISITPIEVVEAQIEQVARVRSSSVRILPYASGCLLVPSES